MRKDSPAEDPLTRPTGSVPTTAAIMLPVLSLLAVAVGVSVYFDIPFWRMSADVAAMADVHPLSGFLSTLGGLLWWTSASIWLFTAFIHRTSRDAPTFRFALASGMLSAYLALDDMFLFHEELAWTVFGVSEALVFAVLVVTVASYVVVFRRTILRQDATLLAIALTFFAYSMLVDTLDTSWADMIGRGSYYAEEGAKLLGIASWCAFCVARCRSSVLGLVAAETPRRDGF
jgi:hypothetical protein